jgi:hypothetical protein
MRVGDNRVYERPVGQHRHSTGRELLTSGSQARGDWSAGDQEDWRGRYYYKNMHCVFCKEAVHERRESRRTGRSRQRSSDHGVGICKIGPPAEAEAEFERAVTDVFMTEDGTDYNWDGRTHGRGRPRSAIMISTFAEQRGPMGAY